MIMNKIGIKEGEIEYFVSEIYNCCKEIGLSADNIDIYLQGLLEFSKTFGMPILPISSILFSYDECSLCFSPSETHASGTMFHHRYKQYVYYKLLLMN